MIGHNDQNQTLTVESWDPLHQDSPADAFWTTTNVGEAMPGVLTPLSADIWRGKPGRGLLEAAHAVGALRGTEVTEQAAQDLIGYFYGRGAVRAEIFALLGDRMPGTSGREVVVGILGRVPDGMTFHPTRRRYPAVALKYPRLFASMPRAVRVTTAEFDRWWRVATDAAPSLGLDAAVALFQEADVRFADAIVLQATCVLGSVSPVHDALARLIEKAGHDQDLSVLLSPIGGAEMAVVGDLWAASRRRIPIEQVVGNHGFHGPNEGELSSRVWRDDPGPVAALVDQYRARDEVHDPAVRERKLREDRDRAEAEFLATTSRLRRPLARLVLQLARTRLPHRGFAKRPMLQSLDVARAAARRAGVILADAGTISRADDVFYLTKDELVTGIPAQAKELIARRRERRETYTRLNLPNTWQGKPPMLMAETAGPDSNGDGPGDQPADAATNVLTGIGVSAGVVEGICRVVVDPDFGEVEPDEILVAPTTDPSWSSIMFISAGLVVDIGGTLSHAAVVARELGIPCVVNTRNGSRVLRTGDRIRVDGSTGVVHRLPAVEPRLAEPAGNRP